MGNPLDIIIYIAGLFHFGVGLTIVIETLVGPGLGRWTWFTLLTVLVFFDALWFLAYLRHPKSKSYRIIFWFLFLATWIFYLAVFLPTFLIPSLDERRLEEYIFIYPLVLIPVSAVWLYGGFGIGPASSGF